MWSIWNVSQDKLFGYTLRRLTRQLVQDGVRAHMRPFNTYSNDMDESDLEGEAPPVWRTNLRGFTVREDYAPGLGGDHYATAGVRFAQEFGLFCSSRSALDVRKLTSDDIANARRRVEECLFDWEEWPRSRALAFFEHEVRKLKDSRKAIELESLRETRDADHVEVDGLAPDSKYRAWSVMEEFAADGHGLTNDRYNIPPGQAHQEPIKEYVYFGAEVVSPILPAGSEVGRENIRRACRVLRNSFRLLKPMEDTVGLHLHLGHKHGWTLLQVKRFLTMWYLMESILIHLHTRSRAVIKENMCGSIRTNTKLGVAIFHPDLDVRNAMRASIGPRTAPLTHDHNMQMLGNHVGPLGWLGAADIEFLRCIWDYTSINALNAAMKHAVTNYRAFNGDIMRRGIQKRPSVRMRMTGVKTSGDPQEMDHLKRTQQTFEIRTMQGTLDANHINHWATVLGRLVHYARREPTEQFRQLITLYRDRVSAAQNLWELLAILDVPVQTRSFFEAPINRGVDAEGREWWQYPDRDRVDWGDPFMVRGHGATHGAQYDVFVNP
ncbi:hypothetical protein F4677DRAFT_409336 [Hypoxylon crocopeplum]|nr:hypothetical protein F4677DRAFT_409336 [Hypoxylon crocopeplum]